MRNLAVSLTQRQVANSVDRLLGRPNAGPFKTVTRRDGWATLKPGTLLCLVEKGMGLKPGEKVKRLALVHVLNVNRERLDAITEEDVRLEGFETFADFGEAYCRSYFKRVRMEEGFLSIPALPKDFIGFFCATHKGTTPATVITRIEWEYLGGPAAAEMARTLIQDGYGLDFIMRATPYNCPDGPHAAFSHPTKCDAVLLSNGMLVQLDEPEPSPDSLPYRFTDH